MSVIFALDRFGVSLRLGIDFESVTANKLTKTSACVSARARTITLNELGRNRSSKIAYDEKWIGFRLTVTEFNEVDGECQFTT